MSDRATDSPVAGAEHVAHECASCGVDTDRRTFLRDSALAVAAALLAVGARRADALAPLAFTHARAARGSTRAYAIPAQDGAQIDKENEVILVRWQGSAYAFALSCPHQNTALHWLDADKRFQCPKHKSKYQPDGTFIAGRATRSMDRYSVRRGGNEIVVDLDALYQDDTDPAGWNAAVVHLV
jgi:nitrite reductase/ring-hydroxylating ferredoxin subunit